MMEWMFGLCFLTLLLFLPFKALSIFEARFPPDHQAVALAQTNLGLYLCPLGELKEAEELMLKAYESNKRKRPNGIDNGQVCCLQSVAVSMNE
jgi:hypothetical protein